MEPRRMIGTGRSSGRKAVVLATAALGLAACGSSTSTAPAATTAGSAAATSPASATTAATTPGTTAAATTAAAPATTAKAAGGNAPVRFCVAAKAVAVLAAKELADVKSGAAGGSAAYLASIVPPTKTAFAAMKAAAPAEIAPQASSVADSYSAYADAFAAIHYDIAGADATGRNALLAAVKPWGAAVKNDAPALAAYAKQNCSVDLGFDALANSGAGG